MEMMIKFIADNKYLTLYFIFVFSYLLLEISYVLMVNWQIYKTGKKLKKIDSGRDHLLTEIRDEYSTLYKHSPFQLQTEKFIEKKLKSNWEKLLNGYYFIKRTDLIFILLGFLGAVFSAAGFLLNQDLEGLDNLRIVINNLPTQLRAGLISILTGILCTIILKLFLKIMGTEKNIDQLIEKISKYLKQQVTPKIKPDKMPEVAAINDLIDAVEKGFTALQEIVEGGFSEVTARMENMEEELKIINRKTDITEKKKQETKNPEDLLTD